MTSNAVSDGDVASIIVCMLFGIVLAVAMAASLGCISLSCLASTNNLGEMNKQNDVSVSNPIQSIVADDIERLNKSDIVMIQPTGKTLQESLVLNEVATGGNLSNVEKKSNGLEYQVYVQSKDKYLFGIPGLRVHSQVYGLVTLCSEVFSLLSFLLSFIFSPNKAGDMAGSVLLAFLYYSAVSWIAVPIWQNYGIINGEDGVNVNCEGNGCIYCRACGICCQLGCRKYFTPRTDNSCRYIPMSLYNHYFMIRHPGMQINNELPVDMEEFGFGRGYFVLLSLNVRGTLNLYIFWNAILKMVEASSGGFDGSTFLAIFALCLATLNLKVYFLSLFFGLYFLPFTYLMTFMMCCTDCCGWIDQLKSKKGTRPYRSFLWMWEHLKGY